MAGSVLLTGLVGGCLPPPLEEATSDEPLKSAISSLATGEISVATAANNVRDAVNQIFDNSPDPDDAIGQIDLLLANSINSEAMLRAFDNANRALGGSVDEDPEDDANAKLMGTMADSSACTTVIYVNGINTTYAAFKGSRAKLKSLVREVLPDARVIGVYNTSATDAEKSMFGGVICPTLDVLFTDFISKRPCTRAGGVFIDLAEAGTQFLNLWAVMGRDAKPGVGQATEVRNAILREIDLGRNVILVCHSQGSFFARDALRQLGSDDGSASSPFAAIGVIMVGSPETAQYMRARFTARVDICSDFVVANFGNPGLSGCVSTSRTDCALGRASPFCHHSFDFAYLGGDARARIRTALQTLNGQVQNGTACGGTAGGGGGGQDFDGDGTPDTEDDCPDDPNKTSPGDCGCGVPETFGCGEQPGLVARWICDGNARDASGNGNHGTASGAVLAADRFGNPNAAYQFDGVDDGVQVPNSSSLNISGNRSISITAWIRAASIPPVRGGIVWKWGPGGPEDDQYTLHLRDGGYPSFVLSDVWTTMVQAPAPVTLHAWTHVAGVYDSAAGQMRLYVNGTLADSRSLSYYNIRSTAEPVYIGRGCNLDDFFHGTIDDVRIYNRALSAGEVATLAQGQ